MQSALTLDRAPARAPAVKPARSQPLSQREVLQRSLGNAALSALLVQRACCSGCESGGACEQATSGGLTVGRADDPLEREADRTADAVMRMSASDVPLARSPLELHRASVASDGGPFTAPENVHDVLRTSGQPLDAGTQALMESRFDHDFSAVRIHTDAAGADSARDVNARAYTVGSHVVFGANAYDPHSATGQRLLAHELTHTIQQGGTTALSRAVLQRDSCSGYKYDTGTLRGPRKYQTVCAGQPCTTDEGKAGACAWSGSIATGCVCIPKPDQKEAPVPVPAPNKDPAEDPSNQTLNRVQEALLAAVKAALIVAGIVLAGAALVAVVGCIVSGACELAALAALLGLTAAMIVIRIVRGGGPSGSSPTASNDPSLPGAPPTEPASATA